METPFANCRIMSLGHSNHPLARFMDLIRTSPIEVLVDTRSAPYSRYAPQFDRENLSDCMTRASIGYLYLGHQLGGRPKDLDYYDSQGHLRYDLLAESESFRAGLARLTVLIREFCVAVLCAEENPMRCHRHFLIAKALRREGMEMVHIRGDGRIQADNELLAASIPPGEQMDLFKTKAL